MSDLGEFFSGVGVPDVRPRRVFLRRRSSRCPASESFSPASEFQMCDSPSLDWEIQLSGYIGRGDYSGVTVRPFFFGYTCISFWKQSGQMPWEKLLPVCVWM